MPLPISSLWQGEPEAPAKGSPAGHKTCQPWL